MKEKSELRERERILFSIMQYVSVNRGHSINANCPVIYYWSFLSSPYLSLCNFSGLPGDLSLTECECACVFALFTLFLSLVYDLYV